MNVFTLTEKATGAQLIRLQMSPLDALGLANVLQVHVDAAQTVAEEGRLPEAEQRGIDVIASTVIALRKAAYQCSH